MPKFKQPKIPSVMGDKQLKAAHHKINILCLREADVMVNRDFTFEDVLGWMFEPEALEACTRARYFSSTFDKSDSYRIEGAGHVNLSFEERCLPIKSMFRHDSHAVHPLATACQEIYQIYKDWALVHAVVDHLDRYGTPSSIKYYWPSFAVFCSEDVLPFGVGRPRPIENIAAWVPCLRDTSAVVARALLLGDRDRREPGRVSLSVPSGRVDNPYGLDIYGEAMFFHVI